MTVVLQEGAALFLENCVGGDISFAEREIVLPALTEGHFCWDNLELFAGEKLPEFPTSIAELQSLRTRAVVLSVYTDGERKRLIFFTITGLENVLVSHSQGLPADWTVLINHSGTPCCFSSQSRN